MRSALFDQMHQERDTNQPWTLQSDRMLRSALFGQNSVIAAKGAMVAYQGQINFEHLGAGGIGRAVGRMMTGEGGKLMRATGHGEVFFARRAQHVFLLELTGDALTINTRSLLAFDGNLAWNIQTLGNAGMLAGGLFNLAVHGHGTVAVSSDGPPMVLDCSRQPTFVDPGAAVCWSANLNPSLKNDFKMGALIGRGTGESFQLAFHGPGFVVVQPSEGVAVA